jgi:hypothetical protein
VKETPVAPNGWNSTPPGEISFHVHQGAGHAFQYLGANNELNLQNPSEAPKTLKKMNRLAIKNG